MSALSLFISIGGSMGVIGNLIHLLNPNDRTRTGANWIGLAICAAAMFGGWHFFHAFLPSEQN